MLKPSSFKNLKKIACLNVLIVFISSLILLIPLIVFVYRANQTTVTIINGDAASINLPIVIALIVCCSILTTFLFLFWTKYLKKISNSNLNLPTFKWVMLTTGFNFLVIIFFSIAFFCIWLVFVNNHTRLLCYSIIYSVLTLVFLICSIGLAVYTNWKIEYFLTKSLQ